MSKLKGPMMENEVKEIFDFARSIAPRNWQFIEFCDLESIIYKPRMFYIEVCFYDSSNENEYDYRGEDAVGFAKHINLRPVSLFITFESSRAAYKKHGEFLVASSSIHLDKFSLGKDVMLHEMAHLAATRLIMTGTYRYAGTMKYFSHIAHEKDKAMHGAIFQRAYKILIDRAVKIYGGKTFLNNINDLEMYQRFEGEGQKND